MIKRLGRGYYNKVVNQTENEDVEVNTGVDDLLKLLKQHDKIPLSDAAKQLGVGADVVQSWVDFLVEEKIIGIEYKFTKPFIYLNQEEEQPVLMEEKKSFSSVKQDFVNKARMKNIPDQNITKLWKNHVVKALNSQKKFFFQEAEKRSLPPEKLWNEYQEKIMNM